MSFFKGYVVEHALLIKAILVVSRHTKNLARIMQPPITELNRYV